MSYARTARLAVSVSEIALTASLGSAGEDRRRAPLFLHFLGTIRSMASDFKGDAWNLPARLEQRSVNVRCIPVPGQSKSSSPDNGIGWCQFCPIATDLEVSIEVNCCPKLFHVLKNTAGFGGDAGAGLTLMLDVTHEEGQPGDNDAVIRLTVTRLTITASRALATTPLSVFGPSPSAVRSIAPAAIPVP